MPNPLSLLTIAGSDSGGAAGLQADLKTWAALGQNGIAVYGMSAITAVTAQNSAHVTAVHYLPPEMIAAQIDAVMSDYGAAAIKTGLLGRVAIVEAVAERLAYWRNTDLSGFPKPDRSRPLIVIDPVLANHLAEPMFGPEVTVAYRDLLFPLADLVTPNRAEISLLLKAGEQGRRGAGETERLGDWETRAISQSPSLFFYLGAARVLLKGLQKGDEFVDVYWDGQSMTELPQPRIDTINTHGSGDTLSAAVCAFVAMGHDWLEAIRRAQAFTHAAIRRGAGWRLGAGHGPLGHAT